MDKQGAANDPENRVLGTYERKRWVHAAVRGHISFAQLARILGIREDEALELIAKENSAVGQERREKNPDLDDGGADGE